MHLGAVLAECIAERHAKDTRSFVGVGLLAPITSRGLDEHWLADCLWERESESVLLARYERRSRERERECTSADCEVGVEDNKLGSGSEIAMRPSLFESESLVVLGAASLRNGKRAFFFCFGARIKTSPAWTSCSNSDR